MSLQASITSLREDRANYASGLKIPSMPVPLTFVHGIEVRIAIGGNERPMLLLPVSSNELRKKLPEADGLVMEFAQYKGTSSLSGYFLQVSSTDDKLESVFLDLVENICSRIQAGEGSYYSLVSAIEDFRHLLSKSSHPVERTRVVGLVGELLFLRQALFFNSESVIYWTGPEKSRRDFLFPKAAVEIKTSEQSTGRNVVIHSLSQLQIDDADDLFMMFYRIEENPGKGVSVGDLVRDIRTKSADAGLFDEKLEAMGFSNLTEKAWNAFRWVVLERNPYRVAEGFPRVTSHSFPEGVPAGVSHVNYQLDLDLAREYAVSHDVLGARLQS